MKYLKYQEEKYFQKYLSNVWKPSLPVWTVNGWIFCGSGGSNQMDSRDQSANGADVNHHDEEHDEDHDEEHDVEHDEESWSHFVQPSSSLDKDDIDIITTV